MGNIVNSSVKQPRNSDAVPSESHDDSIFLGWLSFKIRSNEKLEHGTHVVENILHKTTNRLNSSGSDYNNGLVRRPSQRLASSQREDQYWLTKLAELEVIFVRVWTKIEFAKTYDQWDKQYLLDTMLRDASELALHLPS